MEKTLLYIQFKDTPHFQFDFGFTWKDLKERVDAGKTIIDNGIVYPVLKSI